eukprot:SAG31_NODE_1813_length_7211_cov_9.203600_5_plen_129_part_00
MDAMTVFDEHGFLLEWPTAEEMQAKYRLLGTTTREMLMFMLRTYVQAWDPIVSGWEEGQHSQMQPHIMFPIGLYWILQYNLTKSSNAYEKLIGDSVGAGATAARNSQLDAWQRIANDNSAREKDLDDT